MRFVQHMMTCILVFVVCASALADKQYSGYIPSDGNTLKSAFLGPQQWSGVGLSELQIQTQLREHFRLVLQILNRQTKLSLDEAVSNVEQHFGIRFSESERQWAKSQLAVQRSKQIRTLEHYAERGRFPLNHGHANIPIPIFVDDYGTHCAVGYLMHKSGYDDAVDEIVSQDNYIRVTDVKHGGLIDWIVLSGLTQTEAALIQPAYEPPPFQATLADFVDPDFSVSRNGLTVSELSVMDYSFYNDLSAEDAFDQGVSEIFGLGSSYARPDNFGVAIRQGRYTPPSQYSSFEPTYDDWIFLGGGEQNLGIPDEQDNVLMYLIEYKLDSARLIDDFALTSESHFSYNYISDYYGFLQIRTEIFSPSTTFIDSGTLSADWNSSSLDGTEILEADHNELWVRTYAMAYYGPYNTSSGVSLTSFFHEVNVSPIPEPSSGTVLLALGFWAFKRRRR